MNEIEELRLGLETAYIDGNVASNLMYKPQFVSNNYKEGKNVHFLFPRREHMLY